MDSALVERRRSRKRIPHAFAVERWPLGGRITELLTGPRRGRGRDHDDHEDHDDDDDHDCDGDRR
jgi:hypothetical protein